MIFEPKPKDPRFIDLTSKWFGNLQVGTFLHKRNGATFWLCMCRCGNVHRAEGGNLKGGRTKSCGCTRFASIAKSLTKHGMSKHPLHNVWAAMINRCHDRNGGENNRKNYRARGITVCDRWRFGDGSKGSGFANFFSDMGNRPTDKHTIDRINNDGNYEPGNCRWATWREQSYNKRNTRRIACMGENLTLQEWSEKTGIKRTSLSTRLYSYGWSPEKAFSTPVIGYPRPRRRA